MRAKISSTSITLYGLPSVKEVVAMLTSLTTQYPGKYDNHHVITQLLHPIEKGILDFHSDIEKGKLDLSKEYFPYGTTPEEIEEFLPKKEQ